MKNYIKISLAASVAVIMGSSCKKFLDVNSNPNNTTSTTSRLVFSGALSNSYRNQISTNAHIVPGTWTGYYAHSTSFTGGGNEKQYAFTNNDFNAFDALFDNIADYQYVRNNADKDGVSFMKDPSNVMQCYMYQMLVDIYGSVPYSKNFQGASNIAPVYDNDKAIYEDLVKRLDTAMNNMKAATWPTLTDITAQDVYFQGNKDNWIRFANTIKLRILMRQAFITGRDAYITTNINNTLANGYITANVLLSPGYQNIAGKLNPFYANYGFNEINAVTSNFSYRKMNKVIVDFLKTSVDTVRLQSLAWPAGSIPTASATTFTSYVGIPLGAGSGYATASSSPIGPFQITQGQGTKAAMVMTLAEALLLQAEAAQRYAIAFPTGTAKQLYEAGVLAHFRLCSAPSTTAGATTNDAIAQRYLSRSVNIPGYATGINACNLSWDLSGDKIRSILIQRWVSYCHINALAAWADYRASNGNGSSSVPTSVRTSIPTVSNPEPVRYYYPLSEENANGANTPKNISAFTSRIFWDVN